MDTFGKFMTLFLFISVVVLGIFFHDAHNKVLIEATPLTAKTYTAYCQKEGIDYIPYIQWTWIANPKDTAIVYKKICPITGWIVYDIEP